MILLNSYVLTILQGTAGYQTYIALLFIIGVIWLISPSFRSNVRSFFPTIKVPKSLLKTANNPDLSFNFIKGEILSFNKYFKTEVYSSGGGGYVGSNGGYIAPPRIHSKITTQVDVLLSVDNKEVPLTFYDDLNLREGHNLTLVAITSNKNVNYIVHLKNENTKEMFDLTNEYVFAQLGLYKKPISGWKLFFLILFLISAVFNLIIAKNKNMDGDPLLWFVPISILIFLIYKFTIERWFKNESRKQWFYEKLDAII